MIGMQTKYHVIRKKVEKRMKKRTYRLLCVFASTVLLVTGALTGCSSSGKSGVSKGDGTQQTEENGAEEKKAPKIDGLKYQKTMQLKYATGFDVYYYKGGYKLLDVHDDRQYLIVPEGKKKPADLDKDIVVLKQPLDHIYLAATSAMALFDSMDGLDSIRMSGAQASDWYIDNAKKAMEEGRILFAGKYSEPDYEMLVDEDCDLAIESTMILHTPKVQEMIEDLDIPVFIDRSSYESHPLGRTEWIKAYAAMLNKEDVADNSKAEEADYLIYNATIDSPINSIAELTAKNELFKDFKAVKNGNVWCTGKSLYQATDIVGNLITDIHLMLTDGDEKDMTFLYRVK